MAKEKKKTKAQIKAEEREKYNLVQKLNKRIRDTVKKLGIYNETMRTWENRLQLKGRATTTAYYEEEYTDPETGEIKTETYEYRLLSRSKEDLERYTLEDLQLLERQTPKWKQTKARLKRMMIKEEEETGNQVDPIVYNPSLAEMRDAAQIRYEVATMFAENEDLFYMLINTFQIEDIRQYSTKEIWEKLQKLDPERYAWRDPNTGRFISHTQVGEQYKARRTAAMAARDRAMAIALS